MALIHEPEVLFLDEPTTGLDPTSRLTLWDEVRRLRDDGTTVFLTTQYLEEADQLADRLGIISAGRIVAADTPAALKAEIGRPHLNLVLAGSTGDLALARDVVARYGELRPATEACHLSIGLAHGAADIAPILRALDDAGLAVAELELKQPTLDDVFLAKTGVHLEGAAQPEPDAEPQPELV
jgi:ABC-2 type transport system ATP-binding protein